MGDAATIEALTDAEIPIAWHEQKPVIGIDAALAADAPSLHEAHPDNILITGRVRSGDVPAALAASAAVVGGTLGLLAGIGALAIPGLGPFIAAGPIMGALAGAGTACDVLAAVAGRCVAPGPVHPAAIRVTAPNMAGSRLFHRHGARLLDWSVRCIYTSGRWPDDEAPSRAYQGASALIKRAVLPRSISRPILVGAYASWDRRWEPGSIHASGPYVAGGGAEGRDYTNDRFRAFRGLACRRR